MVTLGTEMSEILFQPLVLASGQEGSTEVAWIESTPVSVLKVCKKIVRSKSYD